MRIAIGSDERTHLTDYVVQELRRRDLDVQLVGPLEEAADRAGSSAWPDVAAAVAECVASGRADSGILFCWTGTGVSMAANKVPGIRAALCGDAETARGAKAWNAANVLCLSLRSTTEIVAGEILDAWFSTSADPGERENVEKVNKLDERHRPVANAGAAVSLASGEKGTV